MMSFRVMRSGTGTLLLLLLSSTCDPFVYQH